MGIEAFKALRAWRSLVLKALDVIHSLYETRCVYVFGSIVRGEATGASDIDILVVLDDDTDSREAYTRIALGLEEALGYKATLIDLHITVKKQAKNPPYTWWLKHSLKICLNNE